MPSILFCTPCYGGLAHAMHWRSTLALKEALERVNLHHEWDIGTNESLVHRARMEMTLSFLRSDHTHMMWQDADIESVPDDTAKLWNLQEDIAVAAYSMKRHDKPLSAWKDGKLVNLENCPKEPFPVDYAGTGFMLISRKAIEGIYAYLQAREAKCKALIDRIRQSVTVDAEEDRLMASMLEGVASSYEGPNGRVPALYMTPIHNDGLESEDYHFCRIAREAGFKIIMDPSIRLKHWGQFAYGGG